MSRRARALPAPAGRHRRDRQRLARLGHDDDGRDLREAPHVGEPEARAPAERLRAPPGPRDLPERSRRRAQPRSSPASRRWSGGATIRIPRAPGRTRAQSLAEQLAGVPEDEAGAHGGRHGGAALRVRRVMLRDRTCIVGVGTTRTASAASSTSAARSTRSARRSIWRSRSRGSIAARSTASRPTRSTQQRSEPARARARHPERQLLEHGARRRRRRHVRRRRECRGGDRRRPRARS